MPRGMTEDYSEICRTTFIPTDEYGLMCMGDTALKFSTEVRVKRPKLIVRFASTTDAFDDILGSWGYFSNHS